MAKYFTSFQSIQDLDEVLNNNENFADTRHLVLGGGSNILFTKDFDGFVLKNEIAGIEQTLEDENYIYIQAGGGVNWHQLVMHCVAKGYGGIENLALIPGNVGASPMQNIGAYGVEIKDVFYQLQAYHIKEKQSLVFSKDDCAFGYRDSIFKKEYKDQYIITHVTYRLQKQPSFNTSYGALQQELDRMQVAKPTVENIAQAVINVRSSKLPNPSVLGNAGSFFKNPTIENSAAATLQQTYPNMPIYHFDDGHKKIAAGWLIEQCGWKGYRVGDAGCYQKQALVLVNYGTATGAEIYNLSENILQSVKKKFSIVLEREVNVI